jgi:hypothetical protein
MTPFFSTPDRLALLAAEIARWRGTRWQHCGTRPNDPVPGIAGDCFAWVHILKACGHVPADYQLPEYRRFEAFHGAPISDLERTIIRSGLFQNISACNLAAGDLCLFRTGNAAGHAALVSRTPPAMVAHLGPRGWIEEPLDQKHLIEKLSTVYRPIEGAIG